MSDPVRVKLCGLRRAQDVAAAVDCGADYLGFVLAPGSPRSLTPEELAALRAGTQTGAARTVGVFRDQPAEWINAVVQSCGLDMVQLHGHEPRDFPGALVVPVLRVLRVKSAIRVEARAPAARLAGGTDLPAEPGACVPLAPNVFAALVDVEDAMGRSGGLGLAADPSALAVLLATLPAQARVFLSGGLTADTVAAAVRCYRPFAVDVSSGIESAPGVKDPARMAAFVAAAKGTT